MPKRTNVHLNKNKNMLCVIIIKSATFDNNETTKLFERLNEEIIEMTLSQIKAVFSQRLLL